MRKRMEIALVLPYSLEEEERKEKLTNRTEQNQQTDVPPYQARLIHAVLLMRYTRVGTNHKLAAPE